MGQTGCGHYSPIAGYHPQSDSALVMDVARFKYPPYWAPLPLLWRAIQETDASTGQGRGYYLMSRGEEEGGDADCYVPLSATCRIAVDKQAWARLAEHFCSVLPAQLAAAQPATPYAVFVSLLSSLPSTSAPSSQCTRTTSASGTPAWRRRRRRVSSSRLWRQQRERREEAACSPATAPSCLPSLRIIIRIACRITTRCSRC